MSVGRQEKASVPELRFPEFEGEWEHIKLGERLKIKSASRVHKEQWTKKGVPFFRSSDVVSIFKGTTNLRAYISHELFVELSKKSGQAFFYGDVFMHLFLN